MKKEKIVVFVRKKQKTMIEELIDRGYFDSPSEVVRRILDEYLEGFYKKVKQGASGAGIY